MSTIKVSKEYVKCSKNFKYFMDMYMFTDSNSESLSYLMWLIIFKKNITIGFITSRMENGSQLIKTIFRYIDNFPKHLKPKVIKKTSSGFILGNRVKFYVMSNECHTRGVGLKYIFIDDFVAYDKLKPTIIPAMVTLNKDEDINKHIIYLV